MSRQFPLGGRVGIAVAAIALGHILAACGGAAIGGSSSPVAERLDPTRDKLAQVLTRGTLVLSTDLDYAPQSFAVDGVTRAASTKCAPNQLTALEVSGYDAETGKLVAAELGVEPCFVARPWEQIIAGGWGDHWDVAWGSGALTKGRMENLYMTQPYYSTPANYFVRTDSPFMAPEDLSGRKIGACAGCTHEQYLKGTLALPGETLVNPVKDPVIVTFASEPPGLVALQTGEIDAFLCSQPVGAAAIDGGAPFRMLDVAAYLTQKSGYVDRGLALDPTAFLDRIDAVIADLHRTGRLKTLSEQYFKADFATPAAAFDLELIGQTVP